MKRKQVEARNQLTNYLPIKRFFINQQIRANQLQVIDSDGSKLGVLTREDALKRAKIKGLDLVLINWRAQPPLAKIIDWGKYQYLQQKKKKGQKGIQKQKEVKEIQLSLKIGEHDFQTKVKRAKKFLKKFSKIRLSLRLKGRENIYPEKAYQMLEKFCQATEGKFDQPIKKSGGRFSAIIIPNPSSKNKI